MINIAAWQNIHFSGLKLMSYKSNSFAIISIIHNYIVTRNRSCFFCTMGAHNASINDYTKWLGTCNGQLCLAGSEYLSSFLQLFPEFNLLENFHKKIMVDRFYKLDISLNKIFWNDFAIRSTLNYLSYTSILLLTARLHYHLKFDPPLLLAMKQLYFQLQFHSRGHLQQILNQISRHCLMAQHFWMLLNCLQ